MPRVRSGVLAKCPVCRKASGVRPAIALAYEHLKCRSCGHALRLEHETDAVWSGHHLGPPEEVEASGQKSR